MGFLQKSSAICYVICTKGTKRNFVVAFIEVLNHLLLYTYFVWDVKVKSSRFRPGVAQRVPGGLGSQIFMTFGR